MRKAGEIGFDAAYLGFILLCGMGLVSGGSGDPLRLLLGGMALVLGIGDLFHLVPRMGGLASGSSNAKALGLGTWITSMTATVYYLLLYGVWAVYFGLSPLQPTGIMLLLLAVLRILLCCLPQNHWLDGRASFVWSVVRNIPFLLMGLLVSELFFASCRQTPGSPFALLPVAVLLSFACYLAVVLFGERRPALGMLMMPKTLCYVWIQIMGLLALR